MASIGELDIDLEPDVQSPDEVFNIRTQNRDFSTYNLSSDEAALFQTQFNTLVNSFDSQLTSELFLQRSNIIANTAAFAKQQFDEKLFGGINAGDNEIAFDVIRPGHIRDESAINNNSWYYEHDGSGFDTWIDSYTVHEDEVLLVLGMMDTGAEIHYYEGGELDHIEEVEQTFVSAVDVDKFGRNVDMLPKDLNDMRVTDNKNDVNVMSLPSMVGNDRDEVNIHLESDLPPSLEEDVIDEDPEDITDEDGVKVYSQPRVLGITFGVGSWMNTQEY